MASIRTSARFAEFRRTRHYLHTKCGHYSQDNSRVVAARLFGAKLGREFSHSPLIPGSFGKCERQPDKVGRLLVITAVCHDLCEQFCAIDGCFRAATLSCNCERSGNGLMRSGVSSHRKVEFSAILEHGRDAG